MVVKCYHYLDLIKMNYFYSICEIFRCGLFCGIPLGLLEPISQTFYDTIQLFAKMVKNILLTN